jgi:bifunctional non-homologous end joining protein LigD
MITHPDKILFPDDGITKGELAAHEMIAPVMVPHMRNRPVTMGVPSRHRRSGIFSKDVSKGFPNG